MVLTEAAHTKTATHIQRTIVGRQNARARIPSAMRFAIRYATRYSCGIMRPSVFIRSKGKPRAGCLVRLWRDFRRAALTIRERIRAWGKSSAQADDGERDERQPDEEQRERLREALIRRSQRITIRLEETDELRSPPQAAALAAADATPVAD